MARTKPLPQGLFHATITGLSHEGRGIAAIEGKTTFIQNALPGEDVEFQYIKMHSKFAEGQAINIIKSSDERIKPTCAHFGVCGGCSLQHMHPDAQLRLKQNTLKDLFTHVGQVVPETWLSPIVGPTYQYRHKARLGVRFVLKKQKLLVGFREMLSNYLADINDCSILDPRVGNKIIILAEFIRSLSNYDEIAQIEVAMGDTETALIFRHLAPFTDTDLSQLRQFAEQHTFQIYLQAGGPNTVTKYWPEDGESLLTYKLADFGLTYWFHPSDFTQVNPRINQQMVRKAIDYLDLKATDKVLDLFCGLGNFTLAIATQAAHVCGVEVSTTMVERAQLNAERNKIKNVEFHGADLFQPLTSAWATMKYDKILIDPARSGALEVIPYLAKWQAKKIVYVSCNPATLARDAGEIVKQGYTLKQTGIIDMFPQTNHVESIAVFVREN